MENDSAREFLTLTPKEANEQIASAARWIDKRDTYGLDEYSTEFAECLLSEGIFENFKLLNEDQRYTFSRLWDEGVRVREAHTIINLIPGYAPVTLAIPNGTQFSVFNAVYDRSFSVYGRDMGSENFKKSVHGYCVRLTLIHDDPLIPFVAFALKDEIGEDRIIKVLDDISESTPLTVIEFYSILKSDLDVNVAPLAWTVNFVR